jgi:hypothetical protein
MRVEWFRGRERFRRFKEEVLLLRREIASTLLYYHARSTSWKTLAESQTHSHQDGYIRYCYRQSDVFVGLAVDGYMRCIEPLTVSSSALRGALLPTVSIQALPELPICTRVIALLHPLCITQVPSGDAVLPGNDSTL